MSDYSIWFVLSLGLGMIELMTGTFYILMIALACAAGGVAAFSGASFPIQLSVTALFGSVSILWLRHARLSRLNEVRNAQRNPDVNLDIGQPVEVLAWQSDGRARIQYRGTQWDARLETGTQGPAGIYVIQEIQGQCLILAPMKDH